MLFDSQTSVKSCSCLTQQTRKLIEVASHLPIKNLLHWSNYLCFPWIVLKVIVWQSSAAGLVMPRLSYNIGEHYFASQNGREIKTPHPDVRHEMVQTPTRIKHNKLKFKIIYKIMVRTNYTSLAVYVRDLAVVSRLSFCGSQ